MNILRSFSDLVFPRTCEFCGRPSDRPDRHVCSACLARLPFCNPKDACHPCEHPHFDRASTALRFEGEARRMLLDFKFNRRFYLRDDLVDMLEAAVRARLAAASVDCVVPVPTTLFHRLDRGYHPVDILARALAQRLDRRYCPRALYRCGSPARQSSLTEEERCENVRHTVGVRTAPQLRGRTVLLVDDILTTGATLSECARLLKTAGAWRVWCVALAHSWRE